MNTTKQWMKLAEECSELTHAIIKRRPWRKKGPNDHVLSEIADVIARLEMVLDTLEPEDIETIGVMVGVVFERCGYESREDSGIELL